MAATSKTWPGDIPDTDIDADSPVTVGLMTDIRDSLTNLAERVGDPATFDENEKDHNHNKLNSAGLDVGSISVAEFTTVQSGAAWSFGTGALGFTPLWVFCAWNATLLVTTARAAGIGSATSSTVTDQFGLTWEHEDEVADTGSYRTDKTTSTFIGFTAAGTNATGTTWATATADITVMSLAGGVTIARSTGTWPSTNITLLVLGV